MEMYFKVSHKSVHRTCSLSLAQHRKCLLCAGRMCIFGFSAGNAASALLAAYRLYVSIYIHTYIVYRVYTYYTYIYAHMAAYCVGSINNTNLRGIGMRILLAAWLAARLGQKDFPFPGKLCLNHRYFGTTTPERNCLNC